MNGLAYLNGQYLPVENAQISVLDRGFLLGDGIYEVIPVYQGKPFRCDEHIARLKRSLDAVKINTSFDNADWKALFATLIKKNQAEHVSIYLQITRGVSATRAHAFPKDKTNQPTIFAACFALKPSAPIDSIEGLKTVTCDDIRWKRCDIKATTLLANILMRQYAVEHDADEAIVIKDGLAVEGAASNLFIVDSNDTIITPAKSHHILGGITRDLVVELAKARELNLLEKDISAEDLKYAKEIWLTSSTTEIMPVIELDGKPVANGQPGPVWARMLTYFQEYKETLKQAQ